MGISKGNSIIFVKHLSIEFLFLQQILPSLTMKSISILIFAALIMLGAADLPTGGGIREQPIPEPDTIDESEPPVPEKKVKPVTKGQFLLIELPELNEKPAMEPWNATSRCGCCCRSDCCSLYPQCCCTPC